MEIREIKLKYPQKILEIAKLRIKQMKNRPYPNWKILSAGASVHEIKYIRDMLVAVSNCIRYNERMLWLAPLAIDLCKGRTKGMPDTPMSHEVLELLKELKHIKRLKQKQDKALKM